MEVTPKAIRRAQVKLLAQAEANAEHGKISVQEAMVQIIERGEDQELVQRAFAKIEDTSGHRPDAKEQMADYVDGVS